MQSGISASEELHAAFRDLLSSTTSRGLLATITTSSEALTPTESIPSTSSDFSSDLQNLAPFLKGNAAAYILLREEVAQGSGKCIAITYVPEKAPVRQKMLFASTRLTLVRELGTEHFTRTLFATSPSELTSSGWSAYLASQSSTSPLTTEEAQLASIKEAEAQESTGTSARRGGQITTKGTLPLDDVAAAALAHLKEGQLGLVQLAIDVPTEKLRLGATSPSGLMPSEVGPAIATDAPRYSFYRHPATGFVVFIYTCPANSKIKERMLYAAGRLKTVSVLAPQHGLEIKSKMEATDVADVTEESILSMIGVSSGSGDFAAAGEGGTAPTTRQAFAKPKRPGRR